jgi:hypothetical protein
MADLTDIEQWVLKSWAECDEDFDVLNFRDIAERCASDRETIAPIVRSLAAKGLTRFASGTVTEGGGFYGSGYGLTDAGRNALDEEREEPRE